MRTAIVGAGLAGLTAAAALAEAGEDVVLFEKARGPGGRTSTRRTDVGAFDHGAQYFTARDPRFIDRVSHWIEAGVVAPWDGPFHTLARGVLGPDPRPGPRYVGSPRMSSIASAMSKGLPLFVRTRIEKLERAASGWQLHTDSGESHAGFDRVVIATPAPQAVPLLAVLPRLAASAERTRLAPCHAVMVTFAEPFDAGFGGAFVEDEGLAWVAAQASKPGRANDASFVLHATRGWSEANLEADPQDVVLRLVEAFAAALDRPLPARTHGVAHRWLYALPVSPLSDGCLWDPAMQLGACGDWACGARVEAAVLSGLGMAEAILGARA